MKIKKIQSKKKREKVRKINAPKSEEEVDK
jgi:hypothetical protein